MKISSASPAKGNILRPYVDSPRFYAPSLIIGVIEDSKSTCYRAYTKYNANVMYLCPSCCPQGGWGLQPKSCHARRDGILYQKVPISRGGGRGRVLKHPSCIAGYLLSKGGTGGFHLCTLSSCKAFSVTYHLPRLWV